MEGAAGLRRGEARFAAYLDEIGAVLGHASRAAAARAYCTGLLLPGARKSVEPMAARIEPGRVGARHQSLHHVVAEAGWDDAALLAAARRRVLPALQRHGPVRYWIIDDTGFPKQGEHSVGVARQYCGQLGKQDNCQVAVSLSVANDHASLPIAYRLYLPETWAGEPERRARAGVPEGIGFETKPEIALGQIRTAQAEGVPPGVVLGDAGYGVETAFRAALAEAGLTYVLGVQSSASLWPPGEAPLPVPPYGGRGRPPTRVRRAPGHQPVSAKKLAEGLPARAWRTVTWREGSRTGLSSRFAALRVRPAHRAQGPGPSRQGALADRARLPGAQTGDRARALRGPRLAGLPPPRQLVHRGLRLPGRRALPFPPSGPLHPPAPRGTCATRGLPAARRRRSGLSATSRIRSAPSASASSSASSDPCHAAHAACSQGRSQLGNDTVRLIRRHNKEAWRDEWRARFRASTPS